MSTLFSKYKPSQILLAVGLMVLLVGAILSLCDVQPYADDVLVGGAVIVIFRGAFRSREKEDAVTKSDDAE